MMMHEQPNVHGTHMHCGHKPFCWSAVVVGALVGVGLGFLLNLFAVALGLSAFTVNQSGATVIAIGGVIGFIIAMIASMMAAGFAAGYIGHISNPTRHNLGVLYGFATWTLALIITAAVTGPVSHYVADYAHNLAGSNVTVSNKSTGDRDVNVSMQSDTSTKARASAQANNKTVFSGAEILATGAFLLFALFFVGAIFTCLGAYLAMHHCRDHERCVH